jgi:NADH-quinone oxidoreductase subunit L
MAGPTPVSALIHAATMVTAGVYLLLRFYPVLATSPAVLLVTASVGAVTAFYGACSALSQRDIKRALAYSTMSQVSYMFMAVGAGDPAGGTFHLLSHAFFKALLFLAAGCLIQALGEEHDLFRMGGLRKRLPSIYWPFLAGTLSLAAFPLTGGFFSKDRILLALLGHPEPVYRFLAGLAAATSLLTALYAFRLFFMVFLGEPAEAKERKLVQIPGLMIWPLWVLAALSLMGGLLNLPEVWSGGEWLARALVPVAGFPRPAVVPAGLQWGLAAGSGLSVLAMAMVARRLFLPPSTAALPTAVDTLFLNGFYLDRLYLAALAKPYRAISLLLWRGIDEAAIDGTVEGGARLFLRSSFGLRRWTNGRISTYLTMLWLGLAGILCLLAVTWYAGG